MAEKTKEKMDKKTRLGFARLEKEGDSKENGERRMYPRYVTHLLIEYRPLDSPISYYSYTINASEGGLMICLQERFEIGEYLHLKIFLSSQPNPLSINPRVQVMWANEKLGEDGFYRHGVRFVDPISEEVQKFKDFLGTFISPFSRIERVGREEDSRNMDKESQRGPGKKGKKE